MSAALSENAGYRLVFRRFALEELSLPAVMAENLPDDTAQDFLALSLASFEDFLSLTAGLKRPSGEAFAAQAGYIDSASLNARIAERDGVHLIAMHVGFGAAAFEFALFCLSQSTVLSAYGDAARETGPPAIDGYPPGFWMREAGAGLKEDEFLGSARAIMPRDPRRYETALFLTILMTRFVWLHELYHGVNGHVGLASHFDLTLGFEEMETAQSQELSPEILQLMELDADQSALNTLCRIIAADLENIEGLRRLAKQDCLILGLLAAYGATWILDEHLLRDGNANTVTHPSPALRRLNLVRTFASAVAPGLGEAKAIHAAALSEMSAISDIIQRFPSAQTMHTEMRSTEIHAGLDRQQDALEALRSELAPYRYS